MIFNDGQAFIDMAGIGRAPNVLDNLIYRRELPVMITVFINPGRTPEQPEPNPRSGATRRRTGRPNTTSSTTSTRASSSTSCCRRSTRTTTSRRTRSSAASAAPARGAIAAFTVAWERPDQFRKVLSIVGSYTNIRGGHAYPDIVRKSEKKPLRIFLQDGRNDNRGVGRDGQYNADARLVPAERPHGGGADREGLRPQLHLGHRTRTVRSMGGTMLPEMMRWLWRDHPVSTDPMNTVERSFREPKP